MTDTGDRWTLWFTRLVQLVGLLIVITEQVAVLVFDRDPEPWLLLVAVAMMLGGLGLRMVLRGASAILSPPPEDKS